MTLVTRFYSLPSSRMHVKTLKRSQYTSNSTSEINVLRRQLRSPPEGGTGVREVLQLSTQLSTDLLVTEEILGSWCALKVQLHWGQETHNL